MGSQYKSKDMSMTYLHLIITLESRPYLKTLIYKRCSMKRLNLILILLGLVIIVSSIVLVNKLASSLNTNDTQYVNTESGSLK